MRPRRSGRRKYARSSRRTKLPARTKVLLVAVADRQLAIIVQPIRKSSSRKPPPVRIVVNRLPEALAEPPTPHRVHLNFKFKYQNF